MQKDKRYSIVLRGNVQDVGFRSRIISAAKIYNIKGYPPINDIDGSVKMICEGPEELVEKFLKDIEIREELPSGIRVEVLEKKELPLSFPIPLRPALLEIEELSNISRKLDTGVKSLKNMEGTLADVKGTLTKVDGTLTKIEGTLAKNTGILEKNTEILDDMNKTLPQRIAQAIKETLH